MLLAQAGLELPESVLYTAALDMDRQLDARLAQHRTHVAVMAGSTKKTQKTLRVFLQSRHHNNVPGPPGHAVGESTTQYFAYSGCMSFCHARPIPAACEQTESGHVL